MLPSLTLLLSLVYLTSATFSGKVLITTGCCTGSDQISEIIDLKDPSNSCQNLPEFPENQDGASGDLINGKNPLICGGGLLQPDDTSKCYLLDDDKVWKQVATLPGLKYRSEGVLFNENTLWISGGAGDKKALKDSYLVSVDENGLGSVQLGPELPAEMDSHCVIKGDGIFFLIGGVGQSQKFFVYDQDDDEWRMGPDLNTQRVGHQCGLLMNPETEKPTIVVLGGSEEEQVEYLIRGTTEWLMGPAMPEKVTNSDSVIVDNALYTFGGTTADGFTSKIHKLSFEGGELTWSTLETETKLGRMLVTAMQVPDEIVDCTK